MLYSIDFTEQAKDDLRFHKKNGDKAILNKMTTLFKELTEHPFTGTGKPESLKYELAGKWSRRINLEHRLIYEVLENVVIINSAKGHYM